MKTKASSICPMDFFTHLMIGFIISTLASGSFHNSYVVFGTLMAGIPDFDLLLYPLWKSLPITRHHGITHTIIFIAVVSAFIDILLAIFAGSVDVRLFFLLCLTGMSHIFCDFIMTGGVNPFYPLTKKYVKLDIDMAVSPFLILYFFAGVLFLAGVINRRIPLSDIQASELLGLTYVAYFTGRVILKNYYTSRPENIGFAALPTLSPVHWKFVKRIDTDDEIKIVIKNPRLQEYVIPKEGLKDIKTCDDLVSTFWHPQVQHHLRVFSYPYFKTDCRGGKFAITWHSAEMGDSMQVNVKYDGDFRVDYEFKMSLKKFWQSKK